MPKLIIILITLMTLTFSNTAFAVNTTEKPVANNEKHIVKANETLSRIASLHKIKLQDLINLNNITNPNKLKIGQTLILTTKKTVTTANKVNNTNNANTTTETVTTPKATQVTKVPNPVPNKTETDKYVIKAHDTFSLIARTHGISLNALIAANKTLNPNSLKIGQAINLPRSTQNVSLASRNEEERARDNTGAEEAVKEEAIQETNNDLVTKVISYAKDLLGCKYSYGAVGPKSFDCSGFTMYVFSHFNINLPHQSASQAQKGSKVSRSDLLPGDLVFFKTSGSGISHVGLYIGNGNFIHASNTRGNVKITSLSEAYYNTRYVTARRIL